MTSVYTVNIEEPKVSTEVINVGGTTVEIQESNATTTAGQITDGPIEIRVSSPDQVKVVGIDQGVDDIRVSVIGIPGPAGPQGPPGPAANPDESLTFTYTNGRLTGVAGVTFTKTIAYNINGTINTVVRVDSGGTTTKTFTYDVNDVITGIIVS